MSEAQVCREPGCGRPAVGLYTPLGAELVSDDGFCRRCLDSLWLAILDELLAHPPAGLRALAGAVGEADVGVVIAENERLRRQLGGANERRAA